MATIITATTETKLKARPVQSSKLGPEESIPVSKGATHEMSEIVPSEEGHFYVTLEIGRFYAFGDHWQGLEPPCKSLITLDLLWESTTVATKDRLSLFLQPLIDTCQKYSIDTPLRVAHFLAQLLHESGEFQYVREIWDGTGYQAEYEGREDLGNCQPGDGKRFMGRGLIQLTGRANYTEFGSAIGVDLTANPELVEQPNYAALVAGWYWDSRGINDAADRDDLVAVTRAINGGTLGIEERGEYLDRLKKQLGI